MAELSPEKLEKLSAYIAEVMVKHRVPGLSIALVTREGVIFARGFGLRDLERGLPATPDTLYCIGSVTKSFAALSVMQLCERGKLSLDDPVEKYVPLKIRPKGESVRIWHLLSHTSGIPALGMAEIMIDRMLGVEYIMQPLESFEDLLLFVNTAEEEVVSRPGERWFYLNEGYTIVGEVISRVTGKAFREYVSENILRPLEMKRTTFDPGVKERDPDVATPYLWEKDKPRATRVPLHPLADAAGGLISSVRELGNYICMYLNWGEFKGRKLAERRSIEEMFRPRVKTPYRTPFGDYYYALGLAVIEDFLGHKLICHGGSVGVSSAWIGFLPDAGVGVAVCANISNFPISHVGQYALALALGSDPEKLPFRVLDKILSALEGYYESRLGVLKVRLKRQGSFLMLERETRYGKVVLPLIPRKLDEREPVFYTLVDGSELEISFEIESKERVKMFFERFVLRKTSR